MIDKKRLGKTNLLVTSLAWGCAPLGSMLEDFGYKVSEKQAVDTLLEAFKSPVNFFDTAGSYGESESRMGKAIKIKGGLPEGCVIATKADRDPKTNKFRAEQIRQSVQNSCERLGIKPVPLVYLHDPEYDPLYQTDKKRAFEEIMSGPVAELEKMKKEGLILHIGISGGPIGMLVDFVRTGKFEVVITHNRWNLLWQVAEPLIDEAHKASVGVVNAAPYASGILAGKDNSRAVYRVPSPKIIQKVREMESACRKYNIPLAAAALQFSLRDQRVNSTVVGISSPAQVKETVRLAQLPIPEELWEEIRPLSIRKGDPE